MWTEAIRREMDRVGWTDGHLLVHVHEQWGMADATQLDMLAAGANGIWAGVCAEGKRRSTRIYSSDNQTS